MNPRVFLHLLRNAITKWYDDSASRHRAAIAYYTLFATAPVLLVVIASAVMVFGADGVRGQIVTEIDALIGPDGAAAIQAILQRASEPRAGIAASCVGLVALFVVTTGAFPELQGALEVWGVKAQRTTWPRLLFAMNQFLALATATVVRDSLAAT